MSKNNKDIYIYDNINNSQLEIFIKDNDDSDYSFLKEKNYLFIDYEGLVDGSLYINQNNGLNLDGWYNKINFKHDKKGNYSNIADAFVELCNKSNMSKCSSDILEEFIKYFEIERKFSRINNEKFMGDFGEALFIYKCIKNGLHEEIKKALFKKEDDDRFDFSFEKTSIEIKTTTPKTSEIKINIRQLPDESNCKYISVIKINLEKNKINENYIDLKSLYEMINNEIGKTDFIKAKLNYYKEYADCYDLYVNLTEVNYYFFDNIFLPIINIINEGSLKDLILCLDVTNSLEPTKTFDQKLISIVK